MADWKFTEPITYRYLDSAAFVKAKINNSGVLALGKLLQV